MNMLTVKEMVVGGVSFVLGFGTGFFAKGKWNARNAETVKTETKTEEKTSA